VNNHGEPSIGEGAERGSSLGDVCGDILDRSASSRDDLAEATSMAKPVRTAVYVFHFSSNSCFSDRATALSQSPMWPTHHLACALP
jgi:hypothetical protein